VRGVYALLVGGLVEDAPVRVPAVALGPAPEAVRAVVPQPRAVAAEADLTPPPPPPQTPEDAERAARGLLERGFRQRAVELLREALDRHPDSGGLRRLLAMTLAREGGFQPAVEKLFLTYLEREPKDVEVRHALASYYRRAGMASRAILQLRLILSADSGHAGAWRDLGELEAGETRRGR
jgi:tetratricopeptide (TPR) repeat protein